ncbi:transglycosylase SLT domain-containing protein [Chlorobaculum sp. MV4-Y]|uniref:lytic transglycosylase domain-containing protein n=1 Tax=Chlorobaculum sp. MV4-Y TaxID=2976335 RepID=UPI0021B05892|nr:lytic transglycosylase domain-containing protein [Chlorobaculum sp. MV4-Y]UWX58448.1 transglycosylase SLT domain-containing protein [Chlorobaculum sp. MV4-Y]
MLDSLVTATYFQDERFSSGGKPGAFEYLPKEFIPQFSDSVYASRIAALASKSRFNLVYNDHVKGFIRLYAVDKRKMVSKVLGLTHIYFPLFDEVFRQYNIPPEMKYLAIVESALNPTAVSRAGARGLWQFMSGTGRMYGLQSSSFIEDRYDPTKATVAACKYLRDLYDMFGDWFLVLAAYNAGAGNVQKAIRRSGGAHDYWEIWPYLPQETRGYVPAFIAVTYVMNYYREHNIRPAQPGYLYSETGRVPVSQALTFEQLNEALGVPMEDIKFLNPQYIAGLIPAPESMPNMITLPKQYIQPFQRKEQEIYAYRPELVAEKERLYTMVREIDRQDEVVSSGRGKKVHMVRKGETIASVARTYGCSVSQIIDWNNLKSSSLKSGQKLVVFKAVSERGSKKSSVLKIKGKKSKLKAKAAKGSAKSKAAKKSKGGKKTGGKSEAKNKRK